MVGLASPTEGPTPFFTFCRNWNDLAGLCLHLTNSTGSSHPQQGPQFDLPSRTAQNIVSRPPPLCSLTAPPQRSSSSESPSVGGENEKVGI